jgi:hypothetical protein
VLRSGVALAVAAAGGAVAAHEFLEGGSPAPRTKAPTSPESALLARLGKAEGAKLTRSQFAPHLKSTFQAMEGPNATPLVLSEVNDLRSAKRPGEERRFSLIFTAPGGDVRPQGTYRFVHPAMGTLALFVTPVDRGAKARSYEAVVNR